MPLLGVMVVNGRFSIGTGMRVAALKNVLFPTFGLPTIPISTGINSYDGSRLEARALRVYGSCHSTIVGGGNTASSVMIAAEISSMPSIPRSSSTS